MDDTRPDLVFGIVRPLGVPDEQFFEHMEGRLNFYNYRVHRIKLSELLSDIASKAGRLMKFDRPDKRARVLMREGNRVRRKASDNSAVVKLGILRIMDLRKDASRPTAFILDSLKREEEIELLREVYGESVLILGLHASLESRRKALIDRYRAKRATLSPGELEGKVNRLLDRDRTEGGRIEFGQDVLSALPAADVFIDTGGRTGH